MYEIRLTETFPEDQIKKLEQANCTISMDSETPNGVLVRSSGMVDEWITEELLVVSRAGVGVDSINIEAATENGTAVLNTPGVNANAVKELILTCMLLTVRPVVQSTRMVQKLDGEDILSQAEKNRSDYVGQELQGKTIGLLGLGAIGKLIARSCYELGMDVLGYARRQHDLDYVDQVNLDELLRQSDFVVVVLPLTEETRDLLNEENMRKMKKTAHLLNFGRGAIVNSEAVMNLLYEDVFAGYITDFPQKEFQGQEKIIMLPHIGGTTQEALEGGDRLAVQALRNFLLFGTVRGSVNFPFVRLIFRSPYRLTLFYRESRQTWTHIMKTLYENNMKIGDMASNRKGDYVYMLIDLDEELEKIEPVVEKIKEVSSIKRLRLLTRPH